LVNSCHMPCGECLEHSAAAHGSMCLARGGPGAL
jgi:hypothetical protein